MRDTASGGHTLSGICPTMLFRTSISEVTPYATDHLEFELLDWCFNTDDELTSFLEIIKKKVKVLKTLEFRGLNIHGRTLRLDSVPQAFGMKLHTVMDAINQGRFESQPHGVFRSSYEKVQQDLWDQ